MFYVFNVILEISYNVVDSKKFSYNDLEFFHVQDRDRFPCTYLAVYSNNIVYSNNTYATKSVLPYRCVDAHIIHMYNTNKSNLIFIPCTLYLVRLNSFSNLEPLFVVLQLKMMEKELKPQTIITKKTYLYIYIFCYYGTNSGKRHL